MKEQYDAWIENYLSRFEHPAHCLGKCEAAVEEMGKAFPELRVVKGVVWKQGATDELRLEVTCD